MVDEFKSAMLTSGIVCREEIIADGKIHRFVTENKTKKDGWYVFYGMAGAFGDWRHGLHEKWSATAGTLPSPEKDRLCNQIVEAQKTFEEERERRSEEVAQFAQATWKVSSETGQSPYLKRKKVKAFGVRFRGETLFVPLQDLWGKLWSFQTIGPEGTKRFLSGGRKKGCFHTIGQPDNGTPIYFTEGYATGASIHMATGAPVVVAFDAGNLAPVVEEHRDVFPDSPLIIAGDDDAWGSQNMGREKAEEVASHYGCSVVFPSFAETSSKPTDFNDLHVLEGLEAVKRQVESSPFHDWPEPTPLKLIKKELSPVIPLPSELIPEPYQPWLTDIAERMQCPLDYVAVGAMIVTASLVGAGCSIRPKCQDSWTVIPNLWGGIIGAPSTMKSPALKEILRPLETLEEEAFEAYKTDQKIYEVDEEIYKARKEAIKKDMIKAAGADDSFAQDRLKEKLLLLKEPDSPSCKRFCTNDATIEKMHELLSKNHRGMLLFRDELMGLLSTWDKDGHEGDRSFYLEAWNGFGSKITDRIGRGTIHTKNLCVSILGSTQPGKLLSYFQRTSTGVENDGLLQRFQLLVYPDEVKVWKLIDRKPNESAHIQASTLISNLAKMDFTHYGASLDEKTGIPYFRFEPKAQEIFYEWLKELEGKLRNSSDEPLLIEHLTKYRKLMPSLALIFHLINLAGGSPKGPVTLDAVEQAAAWCAYLEKHARRIHEMGISPGYQAARILARRIQAQDLNDPFDIRDVYRKEWTFLKTKEEVNTACELLIEKGWLKESILSKGRKSKRCFFVNPEIKKGFKDE